MSRYARLDDDHNVIPCEVTDWKSTRVARDDIDGVVISTVFLPMDHGYGGKSLWFETMIFDVNGNEQGMERYSTWEDAMAGHQRFINRVEQMRDELNRIRTKPI